MRHRSRRRRVDGAYVYESKNPVYRFFAGVLRAVVALLLPVLAKVWCGYRIRGREHARQVRGRGVVVVANHVHPLDCITICGCLFRLRRTRFVTLTENLDIPVLGPLIRAYGGLPIAETASGTRRFVSKGRVYIRRAWRRTRASGVSPLRAAPVLERGAACV